MNWLGKMIGLPEDFLHRPGGTGGGGVIQTTASEATLVCLLAARTRAIRDVQENDPDRLATEINSRLIAYCSDQVCNLYFLLKVRSLEMYLNNQVRILTMFYLNVCLRPLGVIAKVARNNNC